MIGSISLSERSDERLDFFFVKIRDLLEHLIERAGGLADADHLNRHFREYLQPGQRTAQSLSRLDFAANFSRPPLPEPRCRSSLDKCRSPRSDSRQRREVSPAFA